MGWKTQNRYKKPTPNTRSSRSLLTICTQLFTYLLSYNSVLSIDTLSSYVIRDPVSLVACCIYRDWDLAIKLRKTDIFPQRKLDALRNLPFIEQASSLKLIYYQLRMLLNRGGNCCMALTKRCGNTVQCSSLSKEKGCLQYLST